MVDLDSNPTKLIEIVEIGKQLLITRGALTTFSIANDVAIYFAIIPAMFLVTFPMLAALNIMGLKTPESAILSAVIFNALIIIALVPLALRGVQHAGGCRRAAAAQSTDLRHRRDHHPVHRHQGDRRRHHDARSCVGGHHDRHRNLITAVLMAVTTLLLGVVYPLVITGIAQVVFPDQANGQLVERDGRVIGSRLIGQRAFRHPGHFRSRPSAAGMGYDAANSAGSQLADQQEIDPDAVKANVEASRKENPNAPVPIDPVTTSASGFDPHVSPAAADFRFRAARERGMSESDIRSLIDENARRTDVRLPWRASRERARAESCAR